MVKVEVGGQELYLDGYLKENLDHLKNAVKQDWDACIVVDGYEGSGKSVIAIQMAYYCDPTLTLERVVFNPSDFILEVTKAQKYQAIVYDEAFGISARDSLTHINKAVNKMMGEIRQKNLFVFLVLPSAFELDRYLILHRSRALIHVETKGFERGYFSFYNADRKKFLWLKGRQTYSYRVVRSNFYGRFTKYFPLDYNKYKEKKLAALKDYAKLTEPQDMFRRRYDSMILAMDDQGYDRKEVLAFINKYFNNKVTQTALKTKILYLRKELEEGEGVRVPSRT